MAIQLEATRKNLVPVAAATTLRIFSLHWNEEYGRGNKSKRFVRPEGRHEVTNAQKKNVISKQES